MKLEQGNGIDFTIDGGDAISLNAKVIQDLLFDEEET